METVQKCRYCGVQLEELRFQALVRFLTGGSPPTCPKNDAHEWETVELQAPEQELPF